MLHLDTLVKRYGREGESVSAIDGVTLSVSAGELVALYGPSGSGKTTLLMLAAAVLRPDSGSVLVGGRDVSRFSASEAAGYRMRELGFIRQTRDLIPGATALDNAALKLLGRRTGIRAARRQVAPLLVRLGLGQRLCHLGAELSVGEAQRVMVARALSNNPRLVLADEPTGSLDTERGCQVLSLLSELCHERGVAALLVTHDPEAAAYADRIHTLRDGRLDDGPLSLGRASPGSASLVGPP